MKRPTNNCPCGEPVATSQCCGPIIDGTRRAMTAVELMRSRYSAFALGGRSAPELAAPEPAISQQSAINYLLSSWDPATRPSTLSLDPDREWVGLTILDTVDGGAFDATGVVRFRATFRNTAAIDPHDTDSQTERSNFRRVDGAWVYIDGRQT